jgi:hypothetical protein
MFSFFVPVFSSTLDVSSSVVDDRASGPFYAHTAKDMQALPGDIVFGSTHKTTVRLIGPTLKNSSNE